MREESDRHMSGISSPPATVNAHQLCLRLKPTSSLTALMRSPFFTSVVVLALAVVSFAESPSQPVALFNGKDLTGWEYTTPNHEPITAVCHVTPDGVVAIDGKPVGFIATTKSYENYRLHVEWRWTGKADNSGVLLHISEGPMDRTWPISFQVQTKNKRVGDVLPMAGAKFAEPVGGTPAVPTLNRLNADNEKPVGEWNTADIDCRSDTVEIKINGLPQNRLTKCVPAAGKIGFQLEGVAFEIRNVRLEPLPLAIDRSFQTPAPAAR